MAKIVTKQESKEKVISDKNQQYLEEMLKNLDKRIAEENLPDFIRRGGGGQELKK